MTQLYCIIATDPKGNTYFATKSAREQFIGTLKEATEHADFLASSIFDGTEYRLFKLTATTKIGRPNVRFTHTAYRP